jgi:hypothetical protein
VKKSADPAPEVQQAQRECRRPDNAMAAVVGGIRLRDLLPVNRDNAPDDIGAGGINDAGLPVRGRLAGMSPSLFRYFFSR